MERLDQSLFPKLLYAPITDTGLPRDTSDSAMSPSLEEAKCAPRMVKHTHSRETNASMAAGQRRYQCRTTYRLFDPLLRAAIVQQILYSIFSINLDRAEQGIDTLGCLFGNLRTALPSFELLLAGRQKDPWSEREEKEKKAISLLLRLTCCAWPPGLGEPVAWLPIHWVVS